MPLPDQEISTKGWPDEDWPEIAKARENAELARISAVAALSRISVAAMGHPGARADIASSLAHRALANRLSEQRRRAEHEARPRIVEAAAAAADTAVRVQEERDEVMRKFLSSPGHAARLLREVAALDIAESRHLAKEAALVVLRIERETWATLERDLKDVELPGQDVLTRSVPPA